MHASIATHEAEIFALCRRFNVQRLEIFGSAARGDDFDILQSDADFLVEFGPTNGVSDLKQFFGFAEELEQLLGRPVDLIERGAVVNPYLLASIDQARETVYVA